MRPLHRRLEALEARHAPIERVTIQIVVQDGRRPFPIFAGERLKPSAWAGHLLIRMLGNRPAGETPPYPLERIPE